MKKFRFLLVFAVILTVALALSLTAGASGTITAETYEQVYSGEYTSTDTNSAGVPYSGEAYIVFGKVTGTTQAGILVERYANDDSSYSNLLDTKYYNVKDGRITSDGEFGIALFNVQDGYYKAKVIAGDYNNPTAVGGEVVFSKGVANYTVKFLALDGTDTVVTQTVPAGGTVIPPEFEREGYVLSGWTFSSDNGGSYDDGHCDAGFGVTYESSPSNFTNVNCNRIYTARWVYVGDNGDSMAPETFKLNMAGYSKLSVKYTDTPISIPNGSVGVMMFDVLEDVATSGSASIGLTSTDSAFWYTAINADTDDIVFLPTYLNNTLYEYNDISNVTQSTSVMMTPSNVMKEGKSVILVYKPYVSDSNLGWLRAYVKNTGSASDYTLFAGWENLNASQAKTSSMPCLATGCGKTGSGQMTVPLSNLVVGIDLDCDWSTTDDFTNLGIGVAACSYSADANRYVDIDSDYVHSSQIVYEVQMSDVEQSGRQAAFLSNANFDPTISSANDGEYFEMQYTVLKSNIDECTSGSMPIFGFGYTSGASMATNYTGQYSYGMGINWNTGAVDYQVGGTPGYTANIVATSYNVPMKTLFTAGTSVKFVNAFDTIDDSEDIGYTYVYYKTEDMDDYALVASMTNVGYVQLAHRNAYPMLLSFAQYQNNSWRLDMDITGVTLKTYDNAGNVTKSASIQTGSSFDSKGNYVGVAKHTVTFIDIDGNVIDTQEVEDRKGATAPTAPEVDGYDFDCWDKDFSFVRGDMTVQATYKLEEFSVTFKIDGETYATKYYNVENPVVEIPELPEREGYSAKWEYFHLPAGDIVVNAIYTLKDGYYTVNFRNADGDIISTQTVAEGGDAVAPAEDPFEVSYYFDGWAEDFTNVQSDLDVDPIFKSVSSIAGLKLYKGENETFKILNLADIQVVDTESTLGQAQISAHPNYVDQDAGVWNAVKALIEEENPDFIVLNGDNIYSRFEFDDLRTHRKLMEIIDNYNTPWSLVFGNHDGEVPGDTDVLLSDIVSIYSESDYFFFESATGREYGDFAISLVNKETGDMVNKFFFMYTHYSAGWYTDEQVAWYAEEAEKLNDGTNVTPSIFWSHYPLPELQDALVNDYADSITYNGTKFTGMSIPTNSNGDYGEYNGAGYMVNYGMFDLMKKYQSTQLTIHGHEHANNAKVSLDGIRMAYALKTGIYAQTSGYEYLNGGTVIVLDSDGAGYDMYDNFVYDDTRDIGGEYIFNTTYNEVDTSDEATIRINSTALVAGTKSVTMSEGDSVSLSFDIVTPPMSSDSTPSDNMTLGFRVSNIAYPSSNVWNGAYHMMHYMTNGCNGGLADSGLVKLYTLAESSTVGNKYVYNTVNEVFGRGRSIKFTVNYDGSAQVFTKLASEGEDKWVLLSSVGKVGTTNVTIDTTKAVYLAFHTNRDIRVSNFTIDGNETTDFMCLNCQYIEG